MNFFVSWNGFFNNFLRSFKWCGSRYQVHLLNKFNVGILLALQCSSRFKMHHWNFEDPILWNRYGEEWKIHDEELSSQSKVTSSLSLFLSFLPSGASSKFSNFALRLRRANINLWKKPLMHVRWAFSKPSLFSYNLLRFPLFPPFSRPSPFFILRRLGAICQQFACTSSVVLWWWAGLQSVFCASKPELSRHRSFASWLSQKTSSLWFHIRIFNINCFFDTLKMLKRAVASWLKRSSYFVVEALWLTTQKVCYSLSFPHNWTI